MRNLRQLRGVIRKILVENKIDEKEKKAAAANEAVQAIKAALAANVDSDVFKIKAVEASEQSVDYNGVRLVIVLGHNKLPVKKQKELMAARGGKFEEIYDDAPSSKTQAVRQLTNHPKADINPDDQAASLKMLQMIGHEQLDSACEAIEDDLDAEEVIINLMDVERKGKGESHWEMFIYWPEDSGPSSIKWEPGWSSVSSYYEMLPEYEGDVSSIDELTSEKGLMFSVGDLTVYVNAFTDYTDRPTGGDRNHKWYFCGWSVSWNDQPPQGFATSDSQYYFYGPNRGQYQLSYHRRGDYEHHDFYATKAEAQKGAEAFIKEYMDETGLRFGEGLSTRYKAQRDAVFNHDWISDGYR